MAVARYLVQGCDVWLNTPLRPQEASGTSGMKALANGVINLSTLDGWWDEAWRMGGSGETGVGWAIGSGESYKDAAQQDQVEAAALYERLEREIVPAFYERRSDGLPRKWIALMKSSISKLCPEFNMQRMAMQYTEEYYLVAHRRYRELHANNLTRAKELAVWLSKVRRAWPQISVESSSQVVSEICLGDEVLVSAKVKLNSLNPEDVTVEIVTGLVGADDHIKDSIVIPMQSLGPDGSGAYLFQAIFRPSTRSGMHGYAIRVLPKHVDSMGPFIPGLITWARASSPVPEMQTR